MDAKEAIVQGMRSGIAAYMRCLDGLKVIVDGTEVPQDRLFGADVARQLALYARLSHDDMDTLSERLFAPGGPIQTLQEGQDCGKYKVTLRAETSAYCSRMSDVCAGLVVNPCLAEFPRRFPDTYVFSRGLGLVTRASMVVGVSHYTDTDARVFVHRVGDPDRIVSVCVCGSAEYRYLQRLASDAWRGFGLAMVMVHTPDHDGRDAPISVYSERQLL